MTFDHAPWPLPALETRIGVVVNAAIRPRTPPVSIGNYQFVPVPEKVAGPPTPGAKSKAQRNAETKTDGPANVKARPGRCKDDQRIVHRDAYESRIYGHDGDVWPRRHDHLPIAPEVAIVSGLFAHSLHGIHHILLLRQKRIT